jgi:hypothetical protein
MKIKTGKGPKAAITPSHSLRRDRVKRWGALRSLLRLEPELDQAAHSVFRFVAGFGSSILVGSPIALGSTFTCQSLFFFRPRVRSGPSFPGNSPIRTRPLLIVAHGGISTGCRESRWMEPRLSWVACQ